MTKINTVKPLPPADSVGSSVRALNVILSQLSGDEALAALRNGDACANVNLTLWAPAWEGARNFRDHFLLNLARHTRDEWRKDVSDIIENRSPDERASAISDALSARLRITLSFTFCFLTPRHACFLGDALMLAFESEMKASEFATELALNGSKAQCATGEMLNALVLGASGMHRYQPERVMASSQTSVYGF